VIGFPLRTTNVDWTRAASLTWTQWIVSGGAWNESPAARWSGGDPSTWSSPVPSSTKVDSMPGWVCGGTSVPAGVTISTITVS
jgi:hypothetical protein